MMWWAYSGFAGSVVLSIVLLTSMLGMPVVPALSLGVQTGGALLAAAGAAYLLTELRKHLH